MFEDMSFGSIGISQVLIIGGIIFLVLFIFLKKYRSALVSDFLFDGLLSMIDEPLDLLMDFSGVGSPIPWEPGDMLAAFLIYRRERHITGKFWAYFVAAEALSFGIEPVLELLPGGSLIAAPFGWFFNVLPTVTIVRFLAAKTNKALADDELLTEEIKIAKEVGINVSKEDAVRKQIHALIRKEWPIEAIALYNRKKPGRRIMKKINLYLDDMISQVNDIIDMIIKKNIQAPPELITILQDGINQAEKIINQSRSYKAKLVGGFFSVLFGSAPRAEDIQRAVDLAKEAKRVVISAAQEFDKEYAAYLEQVALESAKVEEYQ